MLKMFQSGLLAEASKRITPVVREGVETGAVLLVGMVVAAGLGLLLRLRGIPETKDRRDVYFSL